MQRPTPVRRRHSPAQRDRIVAAYQRSRLTQREFAVQAGIGYSTLTLWLRKATTAKPARQPAFVPVPNLFPTTAAAPAYRLQFPQGVIVELAPGFQSEELAVLLQLVQTL
jgi:transposase-like protein